MRVPRGGGALLLTGFTTGTGLTAVTRVGAGDAFVVGRAARGMAVAVPGEAMLGGASLVAVVGGNATGLCVGPMKDAFKTRLRTGSGMRLEYSNTG